MSISTELTALNDNLKAAKDAVTAKGGAIGDTGLKGLASEIASIPAGWGGGYDPLDPQSAYDATRPKDWLKMPTPNEGEYYFLLTLSKAMTYNYSVGCAINGTGSGLGAMQVQFGTSDAQGNFQANTALNQTVTTSNTTFSFQQELKPTDWYDAGDEKQIIMKLDVSATGSTGNAINWESTTFSISTKSLVCEFSIRDSNLTGIDASSMYTLCYADILDSKISNAERIFQSCFDLRVVRNLVTKNNSSLANAFSSCYSLVSVGELETSNVTNLTYAFQNCYSLPTFQELNLPVATSLNSTFYNCYSLVATPKITAPQATNITYLFDGDRNLRSVAPIDAPLVTSVNYMLRNVSNLRYLDLDSWNTGEITSYNGFIVAIPAGAIIKFGANFASALVLNSSAISANGEAINPTKLVLTKSDDIVTASVVVSMSEGKVLYVPDNLLDAYKSDPKYANIASRIFPISQLK